MGIHYTCTSLRKHCDSIVDPENPNKTIINPDSTMPHTTEIRLKLTYRVTKYFVSVSRTPIVTSCVWNIVSQFRILDDIVEKHQPPQALIPVSTTLSIVKWVEHFEEYLRGVSGVDDILLIYIIRQVKIIPTIANDPIVVGCTFLLWRDDLSFGTLRSSL